MLQIQCPYCNEAREQTEYSVTAEAFIERPQEPEKLTDEQWSDYLFNRHNIKGPHWEQWVHTHGCRKYFLVKRCTVTHDIIQVVKNGEIQDH